MDEIKISNSMKLIFKNIKKTKLTDIISILLIAILEKSLLREFVFVYNTIFYFIQQCILIY
jgi:hypothetical protein